MTNLMEYLEELIKVVDREEDTDVLFLNFSKVFTRSASKVLVL